MKLAAELYKLSADSNSSFADDKLPAAAYEFPADNAEEAKSMLLCALDR